VNTNNNFILSPLKTSIILLFATVIFLILYFNLSDSFSHEAKLMTSLVSAGVILWAFEPFPIGLTAVIILVLMLVFRVSKIEMILSGFSSPAIYLIVGGMMLARAINETPLSKRITYKVIKKWGTSAKGLVGSLLIIMQIQAFFIPATAVRTTLMLPISTMIIKTVGAKPGSNLQKALTLAVAFGGNISGTAVMTAAVGNILTVELLDKYASIKITYFQWLLYTFPLWIALIPAIWILLLKSFPLKKEDSYFPMIKEEMNIKLRELGTVKKSEIRCLMILVVTVLLWISEPYHGLHPSVPALIGVVLMTIPGIGCASWNKVVQINYNTVILISITLSIGYNLIDTGAVNAISQYLSVGWILTTIKYPLIGVIFIVILTQLFHKLISNVSTAVVTLVPLVISISSNANIEPMMLSFTAGLTSLYGFILVVETMPNLIVHGTGLIAQKDFFKPGLWATVISSGLIILVASTWWKILGLV